MLDEVGAPEHLAVFEAAVGRLVMMGLMLTRYIQEAMRRARFKTLDGGACFGEIPGLPGVWASEPTTEACREVLQEVLEEWLILKIRENDPIPRLGRIGLSFKAA